MADIRANTVLPAERRPVTLHTADGLELVGELSLPLGRRPVAQTLEKLSFMTDYMNVINQMAAKKVKLIVGHYCSGSSIPASKVSRCPASRSIVEASNRSVA